MEYVIWNALILDVHMIKRTVDSILPGISLRIVMLPALGRYWEMECVILSAKLLDVCLIIMIVSIL
jgi:hypothetical protein